MVETLLQRCTGFSCGDLNNIAVLNKLAEAKSTAHPHAGNQENAQRVRDHGMYIHMYIYICMKAQSTVRHTAKPESPSRAGQSRKLEAATRTIVAWG